MKTAKKIKKTFSKTKETYDYLYQGGYEYLLGETVITRPYTQAELEDIEFDLPENANDIYYNIIGFINSDGTESIGEDSFPTLFKKKYFID